MTVIRRIALVFLCAVLAVSASPAHSDIVVPKGRADYRLLDGRWVQVAGSFNWCDILQTKVMDGWARVRVDPSASLKKQLTSGRLIVAERTEDQCLWKLGLSRHLNLNHEDMSGTFFTASRDMAGAQSAPLSASPKLAQIDLQPGELRLLAVCKLQDSAETERVGAKHGSPQTALLTFDTKANQVRLLLSQPPGPPRLASSLDGLRSDAPAEFRQYVRPMLAELIGRDPYAPGATDVYAAFPQIAADPSVTSRIEALFPRLSSIDPAERVAASNELTSFGNAGALAVLRMNQEDLGPECQSRLKAFLTANQSTTRFGADPTHEQSFLNECLSFPDPRVVAAAKQQLSQLRPK